MPFSRRARQATRRAGKPLPRQERRQKQQASSANSQPPEPQTALAETCSEVEAVKAPDAQQTDTNKRQSKAKMIPSAIDWQIVFNGIIAAFTIVLAISAIWQWQATIAQNSIMIEQGKAIEKQVSLAEGQLEQMRLEQRAWLSIAKSEIKELKTGEPVEVTLLVHNTGRTPGTIYAAAVNFFQAVTDSDIEPHISGITRNVTDIARGSVIPPDGRTRFPGDTGEMKVDKSVYDAVIAGGRMLFVAGEFRYRDVMNAEHRTTFCLFYNPKTKALDEYKLHNYMD